MTPGRLAAFLKVRPGERRVAARLLAMMVVTWSGFAIGANAVESLLFVRFGPRALPVLFVAVGVTTCAVMMGVNGLLARARRPRRALLAAPLVMAAVVLAMRAALISGARWLYPAMWLVMMTLWTLEVVASWGVAASAHDARQAKRLFPLYASGFILGTAIGGAATGALAGLLGAENLLLLWAAALGGRFALTRSVLRITGGLTEAPRRRIRSEGVGASISSLGATPLLRWMAVSAALFAVLHYALAFLFAAAATARFPEAGDLAAFLGTFMAVTSAAALLTSLLVANRLFAAAGVTVAVVALAAVYVAGYAVLAVGVSFLGVVAFRFVQMVWFAGVWGSGWQALFNVVPPERRERTRTAMDGIALQLGVVLAGATLLLADRVLDRRAVPWIGLGAAALVAAAAWGVRRSYASAVVEALRAGNPEVFMAEDEPFGGFRHDAAARAAVLAGLDDADGAVRRAAMEVLSEIAEPGDGPQLLARTGDDDPHVRAAAVRAAVRIGAAPDLGPFLADPDGDVRLAAVGGITGGSAPGLPALLTDPVPAVRARAAAALLGTEHAGSARAVLDAMASDPSVSDRIVAVEALANGQDLSPLIDALADEDPAVRGAAVASLVHRGDEARDALRAAAARPEVEAGAMHALARLDGEDGSLLRGYVERELAAAVRDARRRFAVAGASDARLLLASALRHRSLDHAVAALQAGGRFWDPVAIRLALENLISRDPVQQANAMETIEAVVDRRRIGPLMTVWEAEDPEGLSAVDALIELLGDDEPMMRACAAFVAAEHPALRDRVRGLAASDVDTLVREAASAALEDRSVESLPSVSLMDRMAFLRRVPLFSELAPGDLKHVAEAVVEHTYEPGERLAVEGEPGEELFVVASGSIQVLVGDDGDVRELARRGPGEPVGEMAVISRAPRMATLVAADRARVLVLDRRRFERILRERPAVSLAVMEVLSQRLREAGAAAEGGA